MWAREAFAVSAGQANAISRSLCQRSERRAANSRYQSDHPHGLRYTLWPARGLDHVAAHLSGFTAVLALDSGAKGTRLQKRQE